MRTTGDEAYGVSVKYDKGGNSLARRATRLALADCGDVAPASRGSFYCERQMSAWRGPANASLSLHSGRRRRPDRLRPLRDTSTSADFGLFVGDKPTGRTAPDRPFRCPSEIWLQAPDIPTARPSSPSIPPPDYLRIRGANILGASEIIARRRDRSRVVANYRRAIAAKLRRTAAPTPPRSTRAAPQSAPM